MIDIISLNDEFDFGIQDTIVAKAGNLLSIQLGDLDYAPAFGVDFRYYLTTNFKIQMETFKAYLVGQMIQNQINVNDVQETIDTLSETLTWDVGDASERTEGLIK